MAVLKFAVQYYTTPSILFLVRVAIGPERYQKDLRREDFSPDPAQRVAIRPAQRLFDGLLANTPCMDDKDNDKAKRFITSVDTFYDRNVKLIVSADATPVSLYRGRSLQSAFQRTISRLEEMQTHAYLAKEHLP